LQVPVAMGVGAAFGFHSEKVKRVPEWIGRNGLEWAWRFIQEPKKLWRRDLIDGPQFVWHVLLELTGLRKYEC
jgi:N-acetylglucosaminyldiphosphoundecaprenol N-acetyl-beta-D-mannosaminyltransferase